MHLTDAIFSAFNRYFYTKMFYNLIYTFSLSIATYLQIIFKIHSVFINILYL